MDLGGKLILEQQQRLSQNQILSLSILAFDTLELKKFIKNELADGKEVPIKQIEEKLKSMQISKRTLETVKKDLRMGSGMLIRTIPAYLQERLKI